MDLGNFNLFIKMIREEYKLNEDQIERITHRLMADDKEFEKVWRLYKNNTQLSGVDHFKSVLNELIN